MTDKLPDNLYNALFGITAKPQEEKTPDIFSSLASLAPAPHNDLSELFWAINAKRPSEEKPLSIFSSLASLSSPRPISQAVRPNQFSHASSPSTVSVPWVQVVLNGLLRKKAEVNNGRVLPDIEDLTIMEGRRVNAAFVYSDLHGFTKLVATQPTNRSFQFLHSFVYVTSLLTKHYRGRVMDCAGDRVLSVFHRPPGDLSKEPVEDAITFALWLQTVFTKAISPAFTTAGYGGLSLAVGVDYGEAVVGCVGIRNDKRIVFFGDAANKAAKLQEIAGPGETVLSSGAASRRPGYLSGETWKPRNEMQGGEFIQRISQVFSGDKAPKAR